MSILSWVFNNLTLFASFCWATKELNIQTPELVALWSIFCFSLIIETCEITGFLKSPSSYSFRGKRTGTSSGITIGNSLLPLLFASIHFEGKQLEPHLYTLFWSSITCSGLFLITFTLECFSSIKTKVWKLGFTLLSSSMLKQVLYRNIEFREFHQLLLLLTFQSILYVTTDVYSSSFSIGEALVVSQGISFLLWTGDQNIIKYLSFSYSSSNLQEMSNLQIEEMNKGILFSLFLLIFFNSLILYQLHKYSIRGKLKNNQIHTRYTIAFYIVLFISIFGVISPALYSIVKRNPFFWVLKLIFHDKNPLVFGWWILILVFSLLFISKYQRTTLSNTIVRKYFHADALMLFVPVIIYDAHLISLSYSCALSVLLLLECIRYGKVWPLGNYLDEFMRSFTDEKDEGDLILTHIYLLFGCAAPLWIFVNFQGNFPSLLPFAGLLIVGIGDAAASIIGKRFGKHQWPGSNKTMEGTAAAFASVLVSIYLLGWIIGIEISLKKNIGLAIATILACLMEAFTDQVDNLVLPLFYYAVLQFVQ